jgi:hypothetical protein
MAPRSAEVDQAGRSGLELVMTRAATDPVFRRRLLADPYTVIRETFGVEVPPGLKLRFIEKDPDVELMLVLPDLIDGDDPLDERLIDAVGGGVGWPWLSGCADE